MQLRLLTNVVVGLACAAAVEAGPPIDLELATDRGVQITAPQEWLQLLAGIGFNQVRIRGLQAGDQPQAENRGTPQQPSYHVVGIITSRDLRLPGGTFTLGERAKLKDYFNRLEADGAQSLTAPRGRFGLTEKELAAVLADLAQPVDFETKGQQPRVVLDRLQTKLTLKFAIDTEADRAIREAAPVGGDDLKGLTAGTGLAIALRNYGLVMRPEKSRGQAVVYRIGVADAAAIGESTLGKTADMDLKCWPIGWEPDKAPGEAAPSLFESRTVEIDGYSLEEALAAIAPLLKVPLLFDHAALTAHHIEPAKVQVKLARERMTYRRMIDRVLSQARLGSQVRVDERGTPFLWITR
jgi:hypothetical protein